MLTAFAVIMLVWSKVIVPLIVDNYGLVGTLAVIGALLGLAHHWDREKQRNLDQAMQRHNQEQD